MKKIYVTQPLLPNLNDFTEKIREIFDSKHLTNMGAFHNKLESELNKVLKVNNASLFNNGTIALLTAIKSLNLPEKSEVITTPFTFAATPHCISWNGLKPVFCDINPETMCIDADKIEQLITPSTSAILGVHVYGFPCDVEKIQKIADKYNLKVIYDAAHAFSTEINGTGIGNFGDITMFSFHATKLFNSIEGGCLTYKDSGLLQKIHDLRNFGIQDEEIIDEIGINGKMNELQAAFGLLNLQLFEEEKQKRLKIKRIYDKELKKIKGIKIPKLTDNVTDSCQYYPIILLEDYKSSRDELYENLKKIEIYTRKYFYPLCSEYECYKNLPSSDSSKLPVAYDTAQKVLCLPFYGDLEMQTIEKLLEVID